MHNGGVAAQTADRVHACLQSCSDSDDGRAAPASQPPDEAELEEDEFERMFAGAKGRKRRGAGSEVGAFPAQPEHA